MSISDERIFELATRNRGLVVAMLENLEPALWATPSLCEGWTVREVAAHLIPPADSGIAHLTSQLIRHRGSFDRMADSTARERAQQPTAEIVAALCAGAGTRMRPPGIGAAGPMTDTVIHLRDMAIPLGLSVTPDRESWQAALDFLVSKPARRGFVPRGRLTGLRFEATDSSWTSGAGPNMIQGSMEDLAMAIAGRSATAARLRGPGASILTARP